MERNVAADRQAAVEMMRVSRQQGVPVITVDGEVVVGFNQPRLRQLLALAQPRLGASIADASSQARKVPGLPSSGAYVGEVHRGTAAADAGLRRGDVVVGLAGQGVTCAADLHRLVRELPRGRDLRLEFVREGERQVAMVRL